ncbi:MAG: excinuclease ABC subunit UvrC [Bacteroidales bacterium]
MEANRNTKQRDKLRPVIQTLPEKPGVYQFYDRHGKVIYVGKAKNLKKRVSSYFGREHYESNRVRLMVRRVADIRHIVVDTEMDALLLENNLIKKYQPRYNVLLKDDKTFPWICIKNEPFPRIFSTRNLVKDGSKYFGPYASVRMMNALLDLIRQLFQYRTCRLQLTPQNIAAGKFKVCLEYHIGNCKGPCEGLQSEEDYQATIDQIEQILKGNLGHVISELKSLMKEYAAKQAFERAAMIKEKIVMLEKFQSKSTVVNPALSNVEVYAIISDTGHAYVNYLRVVNGAIVQSHTIEIKKQLDEPDGELLEMAIAELRQRFESGARELIVPLRPATGIPGVRFIVPKKGDKKKLLELSERNAKYYKLERQKQKELVDPARHGRRLMQQMQKDLRLKSPPEHIECFDVSNTQGNYTVAAMVVFREARPSKKEYRHYNIRTVEGPNDFASMEEAVFRRYRRLKEEKQSLPQLVVVDGGKGQLNAALKALDRLELRGELSIIGIAKRLEEIYFPGDSIPLYIDKKSESLKVIQHMRDEAHRFGITHHRQRRQKGSMQSQLSEIQGIGPATVQILLQTFHSVAGVKRAGYDDLAKVVGPAKAKILHAYFSEEKNM